MIFCLHAIMWFYIFDNLTNNKTFSPLIYFILENWAHLQYRLALYDIQLTGYFENPSLLLSSSAALWIQQELNKELIGKCYPASKELFVRLCVPRKIGKKRRHFVSSWCKIVCRDAENMRLFWPHIIRICGCGRTCVYSI